MNWRACLDPAADELVEVHASHCGMGVNAQAFLAVAGALHRFRGDDPLLADDLPRSGLAGAVERQPRGVVESVRLRRRAAFAIAASIAAPGSSTILPWPTARRAGSRARRARAVSSAVGRCQVARAGSGKRGLGFAVVATPPSVE